MKRYPNDFKLAAKIITIVMMVMSGISIAPIVIGIMLIKYINTLDDNAPRSLTYVVLSYIFFTPVGVLLLVDYLFNNSPETKPAFVPTGTDFFAKKLPVVSKISLTISSMFAPKRILSRLS